MNEVSDAPVRETLPVSIASDETVLNVCDAIKGSLQEVSANTSLVLILSRLDELSEALIDELAWQYHVDFYDQTYDIAQKRELVRKALEHHRHKGTAGVVQDVVSILFENAKVEEWFDYGGQPYHFRIIVVTGPIPVVGRFNKLLEIVWEAKNVRSWCDFVQFHREESSELYFGGANGIHKRFEFTSDITQSITVNTPLYFGGAGSVWKQVEVAGDFR